MKITFLHNPTAGYNQPEKAEILDALKKAGFEEVQYCSTKENDYKKILELPTDLIFVAGGDGTLGKISKHLKNTEIPIALLPFGTANNIAKTLNFYDRADELIKNILKAEKKPFNIGLLKSQGSEKEFLESVGFGLFSSAMKANEDKKSKLPEEPDSRGEELQFDLEVVKSHLKNYHAEDYKIFVDKKDFSGKYLLLEVMNIKYIGPNLDLALEADTGDGFLEVVFLREEDKSDFINYLENKISGISTKPKLQTIKGKVIEIYQHPNLLHIDDKDQEVEKNEIIRIELSNKNLNVLIRPQNMSSNY
jgi:diacylglycerol kinase (ATP)